MKPLDFSSWFDGEEARIALLSSFEFEPLHFESRLLRSSALSGARRIVVFVDADQFQKTLSERPPARSLNQRYLVVPVKRRGGVFHPKLGLMLSSASARVFCGSNNLTQAGSTHNLELLNSLIVTADGEEPDLEHLPVLIEALHFFRACLPFGEPQAARLAKAWLDEVDHEFAWLKTPAPPPTVELVHTLNGSNIWEWVVKRVGESKPRKVQVLSPFYDSDLRLLKRIRETWPQCAVEITAQQGTSNLPASLLGQFGKGVRLYDLAGAGSRRLHAKLLTVVTDDRTIFLAGSANFTTAAFDGHNVETCFGWQGSSQAMKELFDGGFERSIVSPEDFEAGSEHQPEETAEASGPLLLKSAMLSGNGTLSVAFKVAAGLKIQSLGVALQRMGEQQPAVCLEVKRAVAGTEEFKLKPEIVTSFGAAVIACLIADVDGKPIFSPPTWVIQEQRLTHEESEGGDHRGRETEIRETGRGLVEQLDEIGEKEGRLQVIQYLQNLTIRFEDTDRNQGGRGKLTVKIRDPFRSDTMPAWMSELQNDFPNIESAILEFADRHEQKVLRRHARRANINGLQNFLDVLVTVTRLLFVFWRRGVVNRHQVLGRLVRYLHIFTDGIHTENDESEGYIASLGEALAGSGSLLRKSLQESNVAGHLRALLLAAQTVRVDSKDPACARPNLCLRSKMELISDTLREVKLAAANPEEVAGALRDHEMLTEDEVTAWVGEI